MVLPLLTLASERCHPNLTKGCAHAAQGCPESGVALFVELARQSASIHAQAETQARAPVLV